MLPLNLVVKRMIELRQRNIRLTLLAVCPNSRAVLKAGVLVAARNNAPLLFAATLNQVDRDGGYTGWTPRQFVEEMHQIARAFGWPGPLYPCLDHGGPWLKDRHTIDHLTFAETMDEVKQSLSACLEAGYELLHIDPTVDRTLPSGAPVPIDLVVQRTLELIEHAERERLRLGRAPIAYEVGTEEVHGGLADMGNFRHFVAALHQGLADRNMLHAWPCFIVGKVGTDLHTANFDSHVARELTDLVAPLGSLIKGHYTDWVDDPEMYPASGMGGANVGPEFTVEEFKALADLCAKEADLCRVYPHLKPSGFLQALEDAVYRSGRWQKWLQPEEQGQPFASLPAPRRTWLVQTGARYVWTDAGVVAARQKLYENIAQVMPDPDFYVVERIAAVMDKYIKAFHLFGANDLLQA